MPISLARQEGTEWVVLHADKTDADGRCRQLLPDDVVLEAGLYRVRFETAIYYRSQRLAGLYPFVEIVSKYERPRSTTIFRCC